MNPGTNGARERELRELLLESHEQLLRREDALEAARHELEARDAEIAWRKQVAEQCEEELGWLRTALAGTEEQLSAIESSRSWRLVTRFWRLKRRVGR